MSHEEYLLEEMENVSKSIESIDKQISLISNKYGDGDISDADLELIYSLEDDIDTLQTELKQYEAELFDLLVERNIKNYSNLNGTVTNF